MVLRLACVQRKDIFNFLRFASMTEMLQMYLKSSAPDWIVVREIASIVEKYQG
jgi:hypothetical protein